MNIAAIIVAAGRSSRFGDGDKLLAEFRGTPLIRHAAAAVAASQVADAVLVVGPHSDAIVAAAGQGPWRVAINEDPDWGLSGSIRTGIAALDKSIDGAMIVLGDMPFVTAALIAKLSEVFVTNHGRRIVVPVTRDGRQTNPVLWPRALFPELMRLTGDSGAKAVLVAKPDLQAPVTVEDDIAAFDIDTRADLEQLAARP